LWNAVNLGITALLKEEGRRVILVFTDGTDFPFDFSTRNSSLKEVMARADSENVMVYAIGFAGQRVATPITVGETGRPGRRRPVPSVTPPVMPVGKPDAGLSMIAAQTGGGYFELTSTSDLSATFKRVASCIIVRRVLPEVLDARTSLVRSPAPQRRCGLDGCIWPRSSSDAISTLTGSQGAGIILAGTGPHVVSGPAGSWPVNAVFTYDKAVKISVVVCIRRAPRPRGQRGRRLAGGRAHLHQPEAGCASEETVSGGGARRSTASRCTSGMAPIHRRIRPHGHQVRSGRRIWCPAALPRSHPPPRARIRGIIQGVVMDTT
jgi:hypothetical protein